MNLSIITYIMTCMMAVAGIYGLIVSQHIPRQFISIVVVLLAASCVEICGQVLKSYRQNTTFLFNCYMLVEFVLLLLPFFLWQETKRARKLLAIAICLYVVAWVYAVITKGIDVLALRVFLGGCMVLTCAYFYMEIRLAVITRRILKEPMFWISLGFIIYFGADIPVFSLFDYFIAHKKEKLGGYLLTINDVLGIIRYSFMLYGFSLYRKKAVV